MLLYHDLVPWYRLVDPPADHEDEAASYAAALLRAAAPPIETFLELGAGAGHNAFFMKQHFRCTLTDLSSDMQALSRELNQDCEHVVGDMRTLRLGRTFDAVMIHDAIMYMTTLDELRAAVTTAFVHTRPGGAALFAPDCVRETFRDHANLMTADDGPRSLRGVEWAWDPDPADDTFAVEYALLLRDGGLVSSVHDRHCRGVFAREVWTSILDRTGFVLQAIRTADDGTEVFVGRRATEETLGKDGKP
jgi:SAM-dependent methyltransferase